MENSLKTLVIATKKSEPSPKKLASLKEYKDQARLCIDVFIITDGTFADFLDGEQCLISCG